MPCVNFRAAQPREMDDHEAPRMVTVASEHVVVPVRPGKNLDRHPVEQMAGRQFAPNSPWSRPTSLASG